MLVRNEITGTFWNFECKKTLGKSVGDGAIERILPAERLGLRLSRERKIIASTRNGCSNVLPRKTQGVSFAWVPKIPLSPKAIIRYRGTEITYRD